MSNCKKLPYFEGLTDETIKQGSDFDLTEGVTAYDGNDEEIEYSTSPTNAEFDTCDVGSHVIQYHAGQPVDRFLPNICLGTDLAVSIPSYCDNYQSVTKERLIRIIQAANPTIYGIPHVTISPNTPFDPLNGVSAVDDNGNPITDIEYSGYLDKRATGNPITITDGQSVVPVKSLEVELEPIQSGTGTPSPDNVRPISGHTEVNTQRTGKNLWDDSIAPTNIDAYTLSGNAGTYQGRNLYLPNGTYTFSYNGTTTTYLYGNVVNADGSWVSTFQLTIGTITRTPSFTLSDGQYAKLYVASGSVSDMTSGKIQLEVGSTATDYEPYQGTTYTTSLGQTVYGGTLDVVSGELTIDRGIAVFDGTEGYNGNYYPTIVCTKLFTAGSGNGTNFVSNYAPSGNAYCNYANNVKNTFQFSNASTYWGVSNADEFKAKVAEWNANGEPLTIVYPLAEPIKLQLTPQQVMLLTGGNNLWSDGDLTMVYSTEVPTEGDITYPLEGEYTLTYRVTDKCGNVGEATRQITVVANEVQSVQNVESEVSE